ncbi:MAG: RloB family protein [Planctomycetota bacterium]|nr:RloB family protein [Planctomycetota bacterium]
MAHRFRSEESYRRRPGRRAPRRCLLVVCEGEKTEPVYFEALRRALGLMSVEVRVCGPECASAPISVVDYALKRIGEEKLQQFAYDAVWCVFDVDKHPSLAKALDKAKGNHLLVALSNPCFEYWFLLHFEDTNSAFLNAAKLIKHLRKHLPKYSKGRDVSAMLYPKQKVALERAARFEKNRKGTGVRDANSATDVHKLVRAMIRIASS